MIFITLLFNVILDFQSTKIIFGFNIFSTFIFFILIYEKFYTNFSLKFTYYISQHKCFLLWFFNCFYFCQVFKITWLINQTDSTSTSIFLVFIVLLCIKCLKLSRFKAKCYRYFISPEFCKLIREKCGEFLSFIFHALFYTDIFSYIFSYTYTFCNHKVLIFIVFLTFLFALFNNSPYSTYVNNFCIVSKDVAEILSNRISKICNHLSWNIF